MSLDQIIKQRRSIRKYKKKPVSNEQIQLLIQAAVEAPSWKIVKQLDIMLLHHNLY